MPEQKQHRALLAVDDEKACGALRGYFRARGDVAEVLAGADLVAAVRDLRPCLVVLEIQGGDRRLELLRRDFPGIPVVAVVAPLAAILAPPCNSNFGDPNFGDSRCGAAEMLPLPLYEPEMASRLVRVMRSLSCACRAANGSGDGASSIFDLPTLFNSSPRMVEIRDTIDKVANTCATVLIRGESGVGKEIAARMIFTLSERRDKPFVKVNCAAIPHDLLESELFGYEAGAFTGALRAKPGKFELADGGTLFLDEIGEMHPALQAKMLPVLQDGGFARLGAKRDTTVNVRVICATNRQLEGRVAEGLFREDLFYRINVVTVNIPPLRERRSEIPNLVRFFLEKYSALYQRPAVPLDNQSLEAMSHHHWPGNIRELENFCKRYVIVGDAVSMLRELHPRPAGLEREQERETDSSLDTNAGTNGHVRSATVHRNRSNSGPSLLEIGRQAAWQAERQAIENMLVATRWNRREAARRLQVSYKALLNKIKQMEQEQVGQNGQFNT